MFNVEETRTDTRPLLGPQPTKISMMTAIERGPETPFKDYCKTNKEDQLLHRRFWINLTFFEYVT